MTKNVIKTAALAVLATAAGAGVAAHAQTAPTHSTSWTGTVGEDRYGEARFKMRGRFQYDILSSDWEADDGVFAAGAAENGTRSYTRRAFLGVQGRLTEQWRYKVDFVLSPGATEANTTGGADDVLVDDAFLEFAGDRFSIFIGEHNITSPLEVRTSSLDIQMIERSSLSNLLEFDRAAGVAFLTGGGNWSASVAVTGDSLNNQDSSFKTNEPFNTSARLTFAPIFETSPEGVLLLHAGLAVRERDASSLRYRVRPLNGRGDRWIDSGSTLAGQADSTYVVELAGQYNAFGFQAEYGALEGERANGAEYETDGYYVDLFWSPTGEARQYKGGTGVFGAIAPRAPMGQGGIGHVMLTARYEYVDLSDTLFSASTRGEQTSYAVGASWVPVDHVRFMLNYASTEADRVAVTGGVDDITADVITLRTQFDF